MALTVLLQASDLFFNISAVHASTTSCRWAMCRIGWCMAITQVEYHFNRRGIDVNVDALVNLAQLRARLAAVRGYPSHAAYTLDIHMARTPGDVMAFLSNLENKLRPAATAGNTHDTDLVFFFMK